MAQEVLPFHISGLQADGEVIPEPMSLDAANRHELAKDAQAFCLVEGPIEDPIVRAMSAASSLCPILALIPASSG